MNIAVIDISGKVYKYDEALCASIADAIVSTDGFVFACPYSCITKNTKQIKLCSFVPSRFRSSTHTWKRLLKIFEGIVNYLVVLCYIKRKHTNILHLQWLPFLEFCLLEKFWLRIVRKACPSIKIILTMHNLYPHNSSELAQKAYKKRLQQIIPLLDSWIVHTHDAAAKLQKEYHIKAENIKTIHHGVFVPSISVPERQRTDTKVRFLLFGQQSRYKGTDIVIKAVESLPLDVQKKIDIRIMGATDSSLFASYKERAEALGIQWTNKYIDEHELCQAIQDADVLLYPYRTITQSGALLLGLYFQKPMIVSNLPAFVETLGENYPTELFIEPNSVASLAMAIEKYLEKPIDSQLIQSLAPSIIENNSWAKAAQKTMQLYQSLYQDEGTR